MSDFLSKPCTAFVGMRRVAQGPLIDVALAMKQIDAKSETGTLLVFDDATGAVVDLDLRGSTAEIISRLVERTKEEMVTAEPDETNARARGRGRPKLGVVAREVTLLPRHWEWLAVQPGGASQALRRLVDQTRRADTGRSEMRAAREAAYRFMSAMAGDLPGFEGASRALFAGDVEAFAEHISEWPEDVRAYSQTLANPGAPCY